MADKNALYDLLEQSTLYSGSRRMYSYSKSNPNEAPLVERYWRQGGARPPVASRFAQFLLDTADAIGTGGGGTAGAYGNGVYGGA